MVRDGSIVTMRPPVTRRSTFVFDCWAISGTEEKKRIEPTNGMRIAAQKRKSAGFMATRLPERRDCGKDA
jgi:hypothetical protein